jgi:predicted ABC-type ATPase
VLLMVPLSPTCWIIAGPNGAGKTTFAMQYLPQFANCRNFVNADAIAAGLSPLAPERELLAASRLFLQEVERYISTRETFALETTLAGRSYLKLIQRLRKDGWAVKLIYLALASVEMSQQRVAERVSHGGHDIPQEAIYRRFPRSLRNLLSEFSYAASSTECYMNLQDGPEPVFIQTGSQRTILDYPLFETLLQLAEP